MSNKVVLLIALLFWFIFTLIFIVSVVGWLVVLPQPNYTEYHKPQREMRSTWMWIGHDLKEALIK